MPGAIQASSLESETSNAAAKDSLAGYEIGVTTLIEVMTANTGKKEINRFHSVHPHRKSM